MYAESQIMARKLLKLRGGEDLATPGFRSSQPMNREFQARFTAILLGLLTLTAIIFAVSMGLFGGIAPAWHASRREILAALRD